MTRTLRWPALLRGTVFLAFALALAGCGAGSSGSSSSGVITSQASASTGVSEEEKAASDPIALSASTYSVDQATGVVTLTVTRPGTSAPAITVDYATTDGTAVAGTDYTASEGTLEWAENDSTSKSISIPISTANAFSGNKTFNIVLTNPSSGAMLASPGSATVTISGSASAGAGTLQLADTDYTVSQGDGVATISVNRLDGAIGAISVSYATSNGTAVAGTDYIAASGELQWADGDAAAKSFSVPISNIKAFSGGKTFDVALSNATAGAVIGSPENATVTITGAGSAAVGSLQLSATSYSVAQSAGTLQIIVNRTGGSSGAISVAYATKNGTAAAGTDFTATSGTLKWADGDAAAKSFAVPISGANPFSGSKAFTVALSNPSTGATVISPGSATVTISGATSAPVGSLELSAASYAVSQGTGKLNITVSRVGGSSGTASVSYSTVSGTAVAGTDFTAASGTLSWASGDAAAKTVAVAISTTTPFAGTRSFTTKLSSPSTGASLGSPSQASVTISGSATSAPGSLQLSAASYSTSQSAGSLQVTVNRTGGSSGAVSVGYSSSNGSALAGTDYTAANGTLQWANGDAASKTFSIAISNATAFSGNKTFTIALANPSGGATISAPQSASASIGGSAVAQSGSIFWVYHNGVYNWGGDYSFVATANYKSTAGAPLSGPYDIAVSLTGAYGGFLPFAGGTVPLWNFDDSPYTYLTFAFKPTIANQTAQVFFVKVGDIPVGISVDPFNGSYGPKPQAGVWGTYKIPLSDLGVKSTSVYKFGIQDQTGLSNNTFYLDDIAFQ